MEKVSWGGWDNCIRLENGGMEMIITVDVGPRIIYLGFKGGQNLLKVFDEQLGLTSGDEWMSFGGHRLWHAPEVAPRTYAPDFDPVEYEYENGVLKLFQKTEPSTGIRKEIEIELDAGENAVTLTHKMTNTNPWAVEFSPWCLSVMAAGGTAVIPQEKFIPHGEGEGETFLPARTLTIWPFTSMGDARFTWGEKYILMRQDDACSSKQKIGALNTLGWAAYLLNGEVFIKKFPCLDGVTYPDMGCNCEFFTMPGFLEIETLAPLKKVEPGECVTHCETWGIFKAEIGEDETELDSKLLPLVEKVKACPC
ncbi:MAG: hypothetical protein JXR97_16985 [Planctomycetes bacterium]|nr:hypothetical protein [Planctomycetota bacterium]